MPEPALIRYNDTLEYEYVTCFSTYGVFASALIDHYSLPQGFCTYYMTADQDGVVSKLLPPHKLDSKHEVFGTFISKNAIPGAAAKLGAAMDWTIDITVHTDRPFDFVEYFGTPPSIDCQIENAYHRQALQIMESKSKKKKKGKGKQQEKQPKRGR